MRTKAREGFSKALRDAHRWLDELLFDPTQTIELLAARESKSERSIRMTLSLAFVSPALAGSRDGGSPSARVLRQAPDRPADALVRTMARHRTAGAGSGAGRTQLIYEPPSTCRKSFLRAQFGEREASAPASPSRGPGNGILRAETGRRFWAQNSENGRNSVRRPLHTSLTDRNCEGFCRPGNRVGLPGLHGELMAIAAWHPAGSSGSFITIERLRRKDWLSVRRRALCRRQTRRA